MLCKIENTVVLENNDGGIEHENFFACLSGRKVFLFFGFVHAGRLGLTLKRYSSTIASEIKYVAEKCYFKKYTFVEAAEWEYSK
jgi:hypothetical protein